MLLSAIFFAANCLIIRWVGLFANMDGWTTSFTRGVAGSFFVLCFYSRGRGLQLTHLRKPLLLLRGALGVTTISLLYFTIIHLGAARALVINLTYPLFGTLIASLALREKFQIRTMIFLVVALLGLVLFFLESFLGSTFGKYDLLGLFGALLSGATVVTIRKLAQTETAATIYSSQCFITLLVTTPFAASSFNQISPPTWGLMLLAGLIVAYGQILITKGFYHLDVARGSALQMLVPIITSAGAFLLFDEKFTFIELIGASLTLFATWRISINPSSSQTPNNPKHKIPQDSK